MSPPLQYIVSVSAITRPTERITLQSGISSTSHLENTTVRIPLFKLLLHHFIPGQAIDVMDFIVHTEMVLHHQAFRLLLVTPGRFTHVCPEAGDTIVNRFLLISSPPVGYGRQGKVHHSAVSTPRPGHIVAFAVRIVLYKIAQTVCFFPLFFVGLCNYRVLRYDYLKTHLFQIQKHLFGVFIVSFAPFEILQIFCPTDILIDNITRYSPFPVAFGYLTT